MRVPHMATGNRLTGGSRSRHLPTSVGWVLTSAHISYGIGLNGALRARGLKTQPRLDRHVVLLSRASIDTKNCETART